MIDKIGFENGTILEPSAGIGSFLSVLPEKMANKSEVIAIEKDYISAEITSKLYPTARVHNTGYEETNLIENDLTISNIPFGDIKVKMHPADFFEKNIGSGIHNYFVAKSIQNAREKGLVVMITSRYLLDSNDNKGKETKEYITRNCQFLGALRLPNNTFKSNANTEVVTDVLFLRKLTKKEIENKAKERNTILKGETPITNLTKDDDLLLNVVTKNLTDKNGINANYTHSMYFEKHPENIIGEYGFDGLYSKDTLTLNFDGDVKEIANRINEFGNKQFPEKVVKISMGNDIVSQNKKLIINLNDYKDYSIGDIIAVDEGNKEKSFYKIHYERYLSPEQEELVKSLNINAESVRLYYHKLSVDEVKSLDENGLTKEKLNNYVITPYKVAKKNQLIVSDLINLRIATKKLINAEVLGNENEEEIENRRKETNILYQSFFRKHGRILENFKIIESLDDDTHLVSTLEYFNKELNKIEEADILKKRVNFPITDKVVKLSKVEDACSLSLGRYGELRMNFICECLDRSYDDIMEEQYNNNNELTQIFIDENGNHVAREEYLSGDIISKLETAKKMAEENPQYKINVSSLEKAYPEKINIIDINIPYHAHWVPNKIKENFLKKILDTKSLQITNGANKKVVISSYTSLLVNYKTNRQKAEWVLNHFINGTDPIVKYSKPSPNHGEKPTTEIDYNDTQLAREHIRKLKEDWDFYKLSDEEVKETLESTYNLTFNRTRQRNYESIKPYLDYKMNAFELREHQNMAIYKNITNMGGLNDHMVGAGKTLVQIGTIVNMKRLGLINKGMIIGLKSQIPQLYREAKKAYPNAKILFPSDNDFSKRNRKILLNNIMSNDWDIIILGHTQIGKIPISKDIEMETIKEQLEELKELMLDDTISKRELKNYEQQKANLEAKLKTTIDEINRLKDNVTNFDDLGIDFLVVDESQEFKNLPFLTKLSSIRGIGNPRGSKRALNLYNITKSIHRRYGNKDKGVLFSSGTPISNSIGEMYLLFKYLIPNKLKELNITSFDDWMGVFANYSSELEYDMGKFKEITRIREFTNLPELMSIYTSFTDIVNDNNVKIDKPKLNHELVNIEPTAIQLKVIKALQRFVESKGKDYRHELNLTNGYNPNRQQNPAFAILAKNFAKKVSLDPRLCGINEKGNKIQIACKNITKIYNETTEIKGTQLVFCDMGTPKGSNMMHNFYNYLEEQFILTKSELNEVFGENYFELKSRPTKEAIFKKLIELGNFEFEEDIEEIWMESQNKQTYSVYDDCRFNLIQLGIPESEIAFIHDYNTRKQKETLYEKVNKGEIRVLLGSTSKLGTGVNVQQRCVAGHHLDINWRPSDLIQRNGRFARQGNIVAKNHLNNEITAYYYAVNQTLDASMYELVNTKAKFIDQIKLGNVANRTSKDLNEDIDMGMMAAELSGNPIFKERAVLKKKFDEIEGLYKASVALFKSNERELNMCNELDIKYDDKIKVFNKLNSIVSTIDKDKIEFKLKLDTDSNISIDNDNIKKFESDSKEEIKFKDVAQLGIDFFNKTEELIKRQNNIEKTYFYLETGIFWNEFKVKFIIGANKNSFINGLEDKKLIIEDSEENIIESIDLPSKTNDIGLGNRIKNVIFGIPEELEKYKTKKTNNLSKIETLKKSIDRTSDLKSEKNKIENRLIEIDQYIHDNIGVNEDEIINLDEIIKSTKKTHLETNQSQEHDNTNGIKR